MALKRKAASSKHRLEDILEETLRREMFLDRGSKFRYVDDWDTVMHSVYELPIEFNGYVKKVPEMRAIREVIDTFTKGDFIDVKRSESRRKQLKEFVKTMHMYYNIIFTKKDSKVGYGALIYFPRLKKDRPERSGGIVLMARCIVKDGKTDISFEKARFDDFLVEVRPYIEILGDLYRQIRRP